MAAAERAGWEPRFVLRAGEDVEPELLDAVSALGSGTRVIGVYEQRWRSRAATSASTHAEDPGNVGTIIRSAHGLADGPVILDRAAPTRSRRRPCGPRWGRCSRGRRRGRARGASGRTLA